jgi:RNase P subunit RPR2
MAREAGARGVLAVMRTTQDLHVCGSCRRPFVVPEAIVTVLEDTVGYVVDLRCTDCGWTHTGAYAPEAVEALDRELDRAERAIREALELFELSDELERIDRFAVALRDGLILPEDF